MGGLPLSEFRPFSDQVRYNCAFKALNIQWTFPDPLHKDSTGYCESTNMELEITLLRHSLFCRLEHCKEVPTGNEMYLWHEGGLVKGKAAKTKIAQDSNMWFIRSNWSDICKDHHLQHDGWLECIASF